MDNSSAHSESKMKKVLRQLIFFILVAIIPIVLFVGATAILLDPILDYWGVYEYFAIDKPAPEISIKTADFIIYALEKYKLDFQHYPSNLEELGDEYAFIFEIFEYKYEPSPSTDKPQEYMLSFRKRWSIHGLYCYYSGDQEWSQSSSTCWNTSRPTRRLNISNDLLSLNAQQSAKQLLVITRRRITHDKN